MKITLSEYDNWKSNSRLEIMHRLNTDPNIVNVLEIGGSFNPAPCNKITKNFDLFVPPEEYDDPSTPQITFCGDVCDYEDWTQLFIHVAKNGKFDYVICSHTLEDISYPQAALKYMPRVAKAGMIIVPSKCWELERRDLMRGGHHHRWIFDFKENELVLYPKINLIEYMNRYDDMKEQIELLSDLELIIEWDEKIKWRIVNDDYLGPEFEDVINMYEDLI